MLCATISAADSPDEIRGPTQKCNAPHQSQKKKPAPSPAIPAFPAWQAVLAKDTAVGIRRLLRAAPCPVVHPTIDCCSVALKQFPSAPAAPLGPASAQSTAKPQSRFAHPATLPAIDNTMICRRQ